MSYFKCPKCCRKSVPAGSLGCSYCNINSNTGAGMYGNSHPEQPEMAVPRTTGVASASRNHPDPILSLYSMILVQNGTKSKKNDQIVKKTVQELRGDKQSKQEISKKTDINRDFMQETSAASNRMPSKNSHPVDMRKPFLNNECQRNIFRFQGPQKDNAPVNEGFRNNESQWNINKFQGSQKDNAPVNEGFRNNELQGYYIQIPKTRAASNRMPSENCHPVDMRKAFLNNECQRNICQFQGPKKDNAPVNEVLRNNEPERNINIFQGCKKEDSPDKIADSSESVREGIHSRDDIPANPGPSRFHGNPNESKVLDEQLKSCGTSKTRTVVPRRTITCMVCGENIDKHKEIYQGKTEYACCVCEYTTNKTPNTLQVHIRIHCPKDECRVCSKEHTEGSLHVSQQICQFCNETFHCRTRLDEHFLKHHRKHFRENCWECCEPISAHYTIKEGKELYFCCMCGYETCNGKIIQFHNEVHRPKLFCKICKEEYSEERRFLHDGKCSCRVCKKKFECGRPLEDHYEDSSCSEYFIENCMLCKGTLNKHTFDQEKKYYKCCACHCRIKSKCKLQNHLYTHSGLRFFKCGKCGKRYIDEGCRNNHSKTCIPSNVSCEICRARFPSDDSLNKHCLEKHRQTT